MAAGSSKFVHRPNHDGTFDSICPRCFVTIATRFDETDLESNERDHECDPKLLDWYHNLKNGKAAS